MYKHTIILVCESVCVREGTRDTDNTALVVGVGPMIQRTEDCGKWDVNVSCLLNCLIISIESHFYSKYFKFPEP
jgi:hypothetical protein